MTRQRGDSATAGAVPARLPTTHLTLKRIALGALAQLIIGVVVIGYTAGTPALKSLANVPGAASIALGLAVGAAVACVQSLLLFASPAWRGFSQRAIAGTALSPRDIVLVSLAVGVAEEVLFRAAIQPLLGVWATSVVFALVHWNYAPMRGPRSDIAWSLLAIATIFAISVVLGLIYERAGLAAAIAAHAIYDMIVLFVYRALFRW